MGHFVDVDPFAKEVVETVGDGRDLLGCLVNEFEAKVFEAGGQPLGKRSRIALGLGAEYCIATSDVGHHRVLSPAGVADGESVFFAGMAAVGVVGALGEEPAKDTVLSVEDGKV